MATPRKPTAPTAEAVDRFCGQFDDLFCRLAERSAFRHYVIGLLLPRERNKTLTELAALVPGADRQRLHHFLHDAPWDPDALGARRVALWRRYPDLGPHGNGVLIIDETGDANAAMALCWRPSSTSANSAAPPMASWLSPATGLTARRGENPRRRIIWQDTLRQVCPWTRLQLYWHRWSTAPPPPELAALLDHVGHSHPLAAPI